MKMESSSQVAAVLPPEGTEPAYAEDARAIAASYHGINRLAIPTAEELALDDTDLQTLREIAKARQPANHDVKYWGGAPQPWRNGTDDSPITDPVVIAREEKMRVHAEAQHEVSRCQACPSWCCGRAAAAAAQKLAHSERIHALAIRVQFLLFLTFELDLWEWKTWEVVQFLVKPATEDHNRCRFAELPLIRRFAAPATIFASHCWNGKWGDLVAAVCAGANKLRRVVWIDIFAVRQWPGNSADLDFRGVVRRVNATIVAVAPVPGKLMEGVMEAEERAAFLGSGEFDAAAKTLPFCRLWCLVEMFATIHAHKALVFRGAMVTAVDGQGRSVELLGAKFEELNDMGRLADFLGLCARGEVSPGSLLQQMKNAKDEKADIINMLTNSASIIALESAQCTVPADRERELGEIMRLSADRGGIDFINRHVAAAITSAAVAFEHNIAAVDNYVCGEPENLELLHPQTAQAATYHACSAGHVSVLDALLRNALLGPLMELLVTEKYYPLWVAASLGRTEVVARLLDHSYRFVEGPPNVNKAQPDSEVTPLYAACKNGHEEVVQLLLAHGANVDQATTKGCTPLYTACASGHAEVVKRLLAHGGVDVNRATKNDTTPLFMAVSHKGQSALAITSLLLAETGIDVNKACTELRATPLLVACLHGNTALVRVLLGCNTVDVNAEATSGMTPVTAATAEGHEEIVRILREHRERSGLTTTCGCLFGFVCKKKPT